MADAPEILAPNGEPFSVTGGWRGDGPAKLDGLIVNETDLPDGAVQHAVATYFEEHSALNYGSSERNSFQTYANQGGSMLARPKFSPPQDVFGEMQLARDLAERDDDVGATIGALVALAFGEGYQNTHQDEVTVALFDKIAKNMRLKSVQAEAYRELLITSQIISVSLFTRETYSFIPQGTERYRSRSVISPLMSMLPAEDVRVIGNDLFGTADLYYLPPDDSIRTWLRERFSRSTSAGRLAQMRAEDPVSYALFTAEHQVSPVDPDSSIAGLTLYRLNQRMVNRSHFPKGSWKYPRPLLTRNFALLEAKRLLNIMDYALLQGGANYIVIAKKGSDTKPAVEGEVENLRDVVRRAGRTGVLVGDHRVSIEILTPELKELLNAEKRRLLGRKLSQALLRVPEHTAENAGTEGMKAEVEILTRVVSSDRSLVADHITAAAYEPAAERNANTFTGGPAELWYPKIVLQGMQFFTEMILKLLDRGAIPLRYAVELAGYNFDAAVEEKRRQKENGLDELMAPAPGQVPHSSPNTGPQDNGPGRPPGSGQDPAAPRRTITQNPGETVRSMYDEAAQRVTRVGERTLSILEDHADTRTEGRVSAVERRVAENRRPDRQGPVRVVPVSQEEVASLGAVRLGDEADTSMVLGRRVTDDALVCVAMSFRGPGDMNDAVKAAMEWGFHPVEEVATDDGSQHITVGDEPAMASVLSVLASAVASQAAQTLPPITIHVPGQRPQRVVYDNDGRIAGTEPVTE